MSSQSLKWILSKQRKEKIYRSSHGEINCFYRQFEEFIETLKANSRNKALQAWELAENLQRDVIEPIKVLKSMQDQEAQEILSQGD